MKMRILKADSILLGSEAVTFYRFLGKFAGRCKQNTGVLRFAQNDKLKSHRLAVHSDGSWAQGILRVSALSQCAPSFGDEALWDHFSCRGKAELMNGHPGLGVGVQRV